MTRQPGLRQAWQRVHWPQLWTRALGWGSAMTVTRLACSFISIKITAWALGPAGLALVAQFAGLLMLLQSTLGQGLVTGASRLSADAHDATTRRALWGTVARLFLGLSAAVCGVLWLLAPWLNETLLQGQAGGALEPALRVAGVAVAAAIATDILLAGLGRWGDLRRIAWAHMAGSVAGLLCFATGAYWAGIAGALWGQVFGTGLAAAAAVWAVHRSARLGPSAWRLNELGGRWSGERARALWSFVPMLLVNGAAPTLAWLLVRHEISQTLNLEAAGLWQAGWRLSEAALALVTSSISLFFMPQLGRVAQQAGELRRLVLSTLALSLGVCAVLLGLLGLWRHEVITWVLNPRFAEVADWLPWQLVGDALRMAAWVLGMSLVGTLNQRAFMTVTLLQAGCLVLLAHAVLPRWGLPGLAGAYVAANAVQLAAAAWSLRHVWRRPEPTPDLATAPCQAGV